ncbi:MAG: DinB family protein [Thermoanaerobaculia bacterium]
MSGEALREARDRMNAVREEIYRAVEGKSDEQLLAPPGDGGWSAAEVLDHLRKAEGGLARGFEAQRRGEPLKIPRRAYWYRLPMSVAFSGIRFKAPKPVRPRPRAEVKPGEVLAKLKESRAALLAFADRVGDEEFQKIVLPHFIFGRFDGLDWFRFIARHEKRHLGQIRRVLAGG